MNTLPLFPQEDNPILKKCSKCPNSYPATADFFPRNKNRKDGFESECKQCRKEYKKKHYQANKEQILEKNKVYRQENHDQIVAQKKQYYEMHRDEDIARRKAYTESHREQEYLNRKKFRENNADRIREERRAYRQANKEKLAERHRQWEQSEDGAEYRKRYYHENKERISQHSRNQYLKNREVRTLKQRQYLQTEKGRIVGKAHKHKRRAQKLASGGSHTAEQLQEQLKRQKSKCYYCKTKLGKEKGAWHADHVIPLSRGGSNDISNIVIACPDCNMRKHDKLPHEWIDGGRLL